MRLQRASGQISEKTSLPPLNGGTLVLYTSPAEGLAEERAELDHARALVDVGEALVGERDDDADALAAVVQRGHRQAHVIGGTPLGGDEAHVVRRLDESQLDASAPARQPLLGREIAAALK